MAYDISDGVINARKTTFDANIKQITPGMYKFKQAVAIVPTSAWKNYFFREDPTALTGQSGNAIKGVPRGADFPTASIALERVSSIILKYGLEQNIPWEDLISDEVNIGTRTAIKIAEGVTKAVDDEIWNVLTESRVPTNIQSIAIASGYAWDEASASIIDNLEEAEEKIATYNYPTDNLLVYISPKDKRRVVNYIYEKGAQAPNLAQRMVDGNGVIGSIGNKTFVVSNSVTASYALVVVPKRCGNWRELVPLSTDTEEDKFKSTRYRAVEVGVTELTDPKAVVLIYGTQKHA